MKTFMLISAITIATLFTGCQSESFNPVDSSGNDLILNKTEQLQNAELYPFDNKEPRAWANIDYETSGGITYAFNGHKLKKSTNYALCYGNTVIASGRSNKGGNLNLRGTTPQKFNFDTIFSLWYADEEGNLLSSMPAEGKVLIDGFREKPTD